MSNKLVRNIIILVGELQRAGKIGKEDADQLRSAADTLGHSLATKDVKRISRSLSAISRVISRI